MCKTTYKPALLAGLILLLAALASCSKSEQPEAKQQPAAPPTTQPTQPVEQPKDYVTITASRPFALSNEANSIGNSDPKSAGKSKQVMKVERKDLRSYAVVTNSEAKIVGSYKLPNTGSEVSLDKIPGDDYLPVGGIKVAPNVTSYMFPSDTKGKTVNMPSGMDAVKFEELKNVPGYWDVKFGAAVEGQSNVFASFNTENMDEAKAATYTPFYRDHEFGFERFNNSDKKSLEEIKGDTPYTGLDSLTLDHQPKVRAFDKLPAVIKVAIVRVAGPIIFPKVRASVGDELLKRFLNTTWEQVKATNPHWYFEAASHGKFAADPQAMKWPHDDPTMVVAQYDGSWYDIQLRQILARRGKEVFDAMQDVVRKGLGAGSAQPERHGIPPKRR